MTICKQMMKKRWKRKTIRNNQEELKDVWNILEIMFCISSHVFFKELFLDYSVVKKNHMLFVTFFHEIARMLKNFVVTQAIVLEISKALHRVWCNSVLYKLVFLFVFILLSHYIMVKQFEFSGTTSHYLIVLLMLECLRLFSSVIFALNEQKKVKKSCVIN